MSSINYEKSPLIKVCKKYLFNYLDELIHDDSACEDVQEEESAYYFFAQLIEEKATCASPR